VARIQEAYVEYVNKVAEELKQDNNIVSIAVFGSVVKTMRKPNDIDILVVFRDKINRELLNSISEKYRNPPLHLFPRLPDDLDKFNTLWLEIYFRGVVLYDKDNVLMSKMEAWKRKIEELTGIELKEYPSVIRFPFRIDLKQLTLES
jgi:predicted nucleotidyltransferase